MQQLNKMGEMLASCQSALNAKERALKRLKSEQDEQLSSLCRQMMSFECGLRRKEKELKLAIQQRDRIIREQNCIVRFLLQKTGNKTRNIRKLKAQALAKIPQVVTFSDNVTSGLAAAETDPQVASSSSTAASTAVTPADSGTTLILSPCDKRSGLHSPENIGGRNVTTILLTGAQEPPLIESSIRTTAAKEQSENDSDSAIILNDDSSSFLTTPSPPMQSSLSPSSSSSSSSSLRHQANRLRRISRSVSDVMSISVSHTSSDNMGSSFSVEDDDKLATAQSGSMSEPEDQVHSDEDVCEPNGISAREGDEEGLSDFVSATNGLVSSRQRGFLLRHGSFERFKVRMNHNSNDFNSLNSSLTRKTNHMRTGHHLHSLVEAPETPGTPETRSSSSSPSSTLSSPAKPQGINHRNVTKPRDVKNRSSKAKSAKTCSEANMVEKAGSVYRSSVFTSAPENTE